MDSQQTDSRSTHRGKGRRLNAAAAADFCDCPEMAYLGTGWGKKLKRTAGGPLPALQIKSRRGDT